MLLIRRRFHTMRFRFHRGGGTKSTRLLVQVKHHIFVLREDILKKGRFGFPTQHTRLPVSNAA